MPDVTGRRVVLLMGALVVIVLAASGVSALVPGIDGVLAAWPIVMLFLIAGTLWVLGRSVLR